MTIKCPLCGMDFDPRQSESSCRSCPLRRSCTMARCPNCGYETPFSPPVRKR